jgi:hypothetical protein
MILFGKPFTLRRIGMKMFLNIIGIVFLPLGILGILDGLKIVPLIASGHRRWLLIGIVLFIAGIVILYINNKKKAKK